MFHQYQLLTVAERVTRASIIRNVIGGINAWGCKNHLEHPKIIIHFHSTFNMYSTVYFQQKLTHIEDHYHTCDQYTMTIVLIR